MRMIIWDKIREWIDKDLSDENESNSAAVVVRVFILSMLFYLLTQIGLFWINDEPQIILLTGLLFVCYLGAFGYTYIGKTLVALWLVQILTLVWIIVSVLMMGWGCGVQHFIFVLLALSLITGYQKIWIKVLLSAIYCGIRLLLYFYTLHRVAFYPLTRKEGAQFQVINTLGIFLQMTLLIIVYSRETKETEQKLVSYNKKVKELAYTDALTKLMNRRAMVEKMTKFIESGHPKQPFCIAIADIDFFKKVNDTYGHDAGDEVLRQIAGLLSQFMGNKGEVARWGGEEFLFLFRKGKGKEVAAQLDELREQIGKAVIPYHGQNITIHMTFGLAEHESGITLDRMISKADEKLYEGKMGGRNRVVF